MADEHKMCYHFCVCFCLCVPKSVSRSYLAHGFELLYETSQVDVLGAQWLSGRVLDLRLRGCGFEPHWRHCIVSLSKQH